MFSKRSSSVPLASPSVAALGVGLVVLAREQRVAALQPQAEAAVRQVLLAVGERREEGEHE